ncbi:hypothetical protein Glove_151g41 [Diversispora epigaea]|uniref:Uncharacterized protein n=1 Tax=Diversispora epigaea TaxID=1348612 RepID=A0A397J2R5_9GLOM|nr:hypothetical protein Glove_151g41 [Diversispora epigaea]
MEWLKLETIPRKKGKDDCHTIYAIFDCLMLNKYEYCKKYMQTRIYTRKYLYTQQIIIGKRNCQWNSPKTLNKMTKVIGKRVLIKRKESENEIQESEAI